ncbi:hypothetical protein BC831DRAFT_450749 [Entophlyctis helioformis]|nr:hypothetical protein BC831DRAFT_450749 [Entophlyctis helioformis]
MSIARAPAKKLIQQLRSEFPKLQSKLLPPQDLSSVAVNGVGSFVPPICRLQLFYDTPRLSGGGDSRGLVDFVKTRLSHHATHRPYVEFAVVHRRGPPELLATYNNGSVRSVLVPRLDRKSIERRVHELCDSTGQANEARRFPTPVKKGSGSARDAVVPAWDPFHSADVYRP